MPFSLLRPYPLVYGLLADHGLPIALITSGNLLGAVLTVYYQAPHISFLLVGELDVVRPLLHALLIFTLSKVPSVGTLAPLVTVAFDLTAYCGLGYSYRMGDDGHRHLSLQHHGYCVPLMRRQMFVFHRNLLVVLKTAKIRSLSPESVFGQTLFFLPRTSQQSDFKSCTFQWNPAERRLQQ